MGECQLVAMACCGISTPSISATVLRNGLTDSEDPGCRSQGLERCVGGRKSGTTRGANRALCMNRQLDTFWGGKWARTLVHVPYREERGM